MSKRYSELDWTKHDTDDTIFVCWNTEDVRQLRPDLTDADCRKILHAVKDSHDATLGISWDVIESISYDMYPIQV